MKMRETVRRLVAGTRNPFRTFTIAPNYIVSPLDAVAETVGSEMVETAFQRKHFVGIVSALSRFFDDPEADRALKKAVHVIIEQRLRHRALLLDPPERHGLLPSGLQKKAGPLDWEAERHLAAKDGTLALPLTGPATFSSLKLWTFCLTWALVLAASVIHMGLFRSRIKIRTQNFAVAFPDFGPLAKLKPLERMIARDIPDPTFICILENGVSQSGANASFPSIELRKLKVPVLFWWLKVVPSAFQLIFRALWQLIQPGRDHLTTFVVGEALHLSFTAVRIWPIALNLKFNAYLDNEEYSALHNVKAMLFRRHCAGPLVRWPLSQIDSRGCLLSYLAYDLFLSSGPYQARTYASTWSPAMKTHSIGQLQWDIHFADKQLVDPILRGLIESKIARGMRMVAFFGSSSVMGASEVAIATLRIILSELDRNEDLFVVIKPKLNADLTQLIERKEETRTWLSHPRVIMVRYPLHGVETCPAGFLMEHMTLGVGGLGSAQFEALARSKPYLSYFPVVPDTPLRQKMMNDGLCFNDLDQFRSRLVELLAGDNQPCLAWYADAIDPFGDDRALSRAATIIKELLSQPI
jgi:hypothetical protein